MRCSAVFLDRQTRVLPQKLRAVGLRGTASPRMDTFSQAKKMLQQAHPHIPQLVVVDLDYTIWPLWCDMYRARDTDVVQLFPETKAILDALRDSSIRLAVASRSPTPDVARAFLKKVGLLTGYFEKMVIVPYVNKDSRHFPELRKQLGVEYKDMMFFDDEQLQYRVVGKLGVTSILVSTSHGLCLQALEKGLKQYRQLHS